MKHMPPFTRYILTLFIFLIPFSVSTQPNFAPVIEGRAFQFPRDHGSHPEFKTEWWYFTGHLQSKEGRTFGFQWTVFRVSLQGITSTNSKTSETQSSLRAREIYLGHFAISDLRSRKFYYTESMARGAHNIATSSEQTLQLKLPRFEANLENNQLRLKAAEFEPQLGLDLEIKFTEPPLLQGKEGYSPKSIEPGFASYYYSIPHLQAAGNLTLGKETFAVSGKAWMDHEFSSNQLSQSLIGWDWFGLPLGGKSSLTIYRLRHATDSKQDFIAGTWVDAQGQIQKLTREEIHLTTSQIWKSPHSGAEYPLQWKIEIPKHQVSLEVKAHFEDQELLTPKSTQINYWEGSVSVIGSAQGLSIDSKGYLEMTGYAKKFGWGL